MSADAASVSKADADEDTDPAYSHSDDYSTQSDHEEILENETGGKRPSRSKNRTEYEQRLQELEAHVAKLEEQLRLLVSLTPQASLASSRQDYPPKVTRNLNLVGPSLKESTFQKQDSAPYGSNAVDPTLNYVSRRSFQLGSSRNAVDILGNESGEAQSIRLNSLFIIAALRRFLGHEASNHHSSRSVKWIIHRPFKAMIENDVKIRQNITTFLEYLHRGLPAARKGKTGRRTSTNEDEDDTGSMNVATSHDFWQTALISCGMYCCELCTETIWLECPTLKHTRSLLACISQLLDRHVSPVTHQFRSRSIDTVAFPDLWYLFQPGDEILSADTNEARNCLVLKVLKTFGGQERMNGELPTGSLKPDFLSKSVNLLTSASPFVLDAYYLDHDGSSLVPVQQRFVIEPFIGKRYISDLTTYPIEYSRDHGREDFVARGRKFFNLAQSESGTRMTCRGSDLSGADINEEVVVDGTEFLRLNNDQRPRFNAPKIDLAELNTRDYMAAEATIRDETKRLSRSGTDVPKDDDFAICNYRLHAYKLSSRIWIAVHVDTLSHPNVPAGKLGFDFLILPNGHKEILRAQLEQHLYKRASDPLRAVFSSDLVPGKGQGLVILLHGAPGLGKTTTAECIAEMIQRPLYSITAGALGTTATDIESRLASHLHLATKWGCVVLLDEADLFLSARNRNDLGRNGVVILFLRLMDYYPGILVLTTNRVGTLDEGVLSRINIPLFFPNFDENTTVRVWETFINRANMMWAALGRKDIRIDEQEVIQYVKESIFVGRSRPGRIWNGREIRNVFQAAIDLGEHTSRKQATNGDRPVTETEPYIIGRKEFEAIAEVLNQFDRYLEELHLASADRRAHREGLRSSRPAGQEGRRVKDGKAHERPRSPSELDAVSD